MNSNSFSQLITILQERTAPEEGLAFSVWLSRNTFTLVQHDDISGNTFTFKGIIQNNTCSGIWTKSSASSVTDNDIDFDLAPCR